MHFAVICICKYDLREASYILSYAYVQNHTKIKEFSCVLCFSHNISKSSTKSNNVSYCNILIRTCEISLFESTLKFVATTCDVLPRHLRFGCITQVSMIYVRHHIYFIVRIRTKNKNHTKIKEFIRVSFAKSIYLFNQNLQIRFAFESKQSLIKPNSN